MSDEISPVRALMGSDDDEGTLQDEEKRQARRRKLRSLTPGKRRKVLRDEQRKTMAYDIPEEIIQAVRDLSGELDISQSQIVAYALVEWLNRYQSGETELPPKSAWQPTRGQYLWKIEIPPLKR
jgi:hypothetical protein